MTPHMSSDMSSDMSFASTSCDMSSDMSSAICHPDRHAEFFFTDVVQSYVQSKGTVFPDRIFTYLKGVGNEHVNI